MPRTLDVGCGRRKTPGSIGMDILGDSDADVIADLNASWPFEKESFDTVIATHVLEHVPNMIHVMDEAWRVLVPGGALMARGPHFSSPHLVWSDPTHWRGLSASMFQHFEPQSQLHYGNARFTIQRASLYTGWADPIEGERWWRKGVRPLCRAYERACSRDHASRNRAERIWCRLMPFEEIDVHLVCVGK